MKQLAFAIYDSASEAYMRPFFMNTIGQAIRQFEDLAVDQEHPIGQHPQDYSLFQIGSYTDHDGVLCASPFECLCRAHEVVAARRNQVTED